MSCNHARKFHSESDDLRTLRVVVVPIDFVWFEWRILVEWDVILLNGTPWFHAIDQCRCPICHEFLSMYRLGEVCINEWAMIWKCSSEFCNYISLHDPAERDYKEDWKSREQKSPMAEFGTHAFIRIICAGRFELSVVRAMRNLITAGMNATAAWSLFPVNFYAYK